MKIREVNQVRELFDIIAKKHALTDEESQGEVVGAVLGIIETVVLDLRRIADAHESNDE